MLARVVGGALINTCSLTLKKTAISMPSKTRSSTFASAFNALHNELDWPRLSRMRGGGAARALISSTLFCEFCERSAVQTIPLWPILLLLQA